MHYQRKRVGRGVRCVSVLPSGKWKFAKSSLCGIAGAGLGRSRRRRGSRRRSYGGGYAGLGTYSVVRTPSGPRCKAYRGKFVPMGLCRR